MDPAPVAIVTGAARGIGAATVHRLAIGGWRVVAVDICRDDPALQYALGTREQLAAVATPSMVRFSPAPLMCGVRKTSPQQSNSRGGDSVDSMSRWRPRPS